MDNQILVNVHAYICTHLEAMSYVTIKRWFKRSRNGDFARRPKIRTSHGNRAKLKHALVSDSDQSTRNIASKLERSQKGIHYQFKLLGLVPKLGQWVT